MRRVSAMGRRRGSKDSASLCADRRGEGRPGSALHISCRAQPQGGAAAHRVDPCRDRASVPIPRGRSTGRGRRRAGQRAGYAEAHRDRIPLCHVLPCDGRRPGDIARLSPGAKTLSKTGTRSMADDPEGYTVSSGNVFADAGLPDADERLARQTHAPHHATH